MKNINYYLNILESHYKEKHYFSSNETNEMLIRLLKEDFVNVNNFSFETFKKQINDLINIIKRIGECEKVLVLQTLFSDIIKPIGEKYYKQFLNDRFYELKDFFNLKSSNPYNKEDKKIKEIIKVNLQKQIDFFGLKENYTKEEIIRQFRKLVLIHHPDKGGNKENFQLLQQYKNELLNNLN